MGNVRSNLSTLKRACILGAVLYTTGSTATEEELAAIRPNLNLGRSYSGTISTEIAVLSGAGFDNPMAHIRRGANVIAPKTGKWRQRWIVQEKDLLWKDRDKDKQFKYAGSYHSKEGRYWVVHVDGTKIEGQPQPLSQTCARGKEENACVEVWWVEGITESTPGRTIFGVEVFIPRQTGREEWNQEKLDRMIAAIGKKPIVERNEIKLTVECRSGYGTDDFEIWIDTSEWEARTSCTVTPWQTNDTTGSKAPVCEIREIRPAEPRGPISLGPDGGDCTRGGRW